MLVIGLCVHRIGSNLCLGLVRNRCRNAHLLEVELLGRGSGRRLAYYLLLLFLLAFLFFWLHFCVRVTLDVQRVRPFQNLWLFSSRRLQILKLISVHSTLRLIFSTLTFLVKACLLERPLVVFILVLRSSCVLVVT